MRIPLPLLLLFLAGCSQSDRALPFTDDLAMARGLAHGGLIVVHTALPDRPLARAMAESTFADPRVIAAATHMPHVRLAPAALHALLPDELPGTPALATAVLTPDLQPVAIHRGFLGPERYLAFLERARAAAGHSSSDARGLARLGRPNRARRLLEETYHCTPSPAIALHLAQLHLQDGAVATASSWLDRAGNAPHIHTELLRLRILMEQRRPSAAADRARRLLEEHDTGPFGPTLRTLLAAAEHDRARHGPAWAALIPALAAPTPWNREPLGIAAQLLEPGHRH